MLVFLIFIVFVTSLILLFQQLGSFLCIVCPALLNHYYRRRVLAAWMPFFLIICPDLVNNWNRYSTIRKLIILLYILQNLIFIVNFVLHLAETSLSTQVRNFTLMRLDVVLSLYFLLLATLVLLLAPNYLLAIIKLVQIIRESTNNK